MYYLYLFLFVIFFGIFSLLYIYNILVRTPCAQTPKRSTEEGRPGSAVVDVWARFVQCVALGVRSFFFFSVEVDNIRRFPGFSL